SSAAVVRVRALATRRSACSDVELEQQDVAVLDEVFLAFLPQLSGLARARLAAERDVVIEGNCFSTNKAALEIGVDLAGGLRRLGTGGEGPGAGLLRSGGEEGLQAE